MISKNQKPTDIEAHIKYTCPNKKCKFDHWISLKEAQTKNFKIVCDCSTVFSPKPIQKILIKYKKFKKKIPKVESVEKTQHIISIDLLTKSSRIMETFGFKKNEADTLLSEFYKNNPINDYKELVQKTLAFNGGKNVECN
jgi:superfamily II DNA helicase RecQ